MSRSNIRMMTHNLWKNDENRPNWAANGQDCSAGARAAGFVRVYRELQPDIVGCQEMSARMADELIRGCLAEGNRYALLWGRDTPILYRPDKFELVDSAFSLYPDALPGYDGVFNNSKTKSWTIAVFRVKENRTTFIFASTHLWWKSSNPEAANYQPHSDKARAYQLGLLLDQIAAFREQYACPAVIVGDLNAGYGSIALETAFARGCLHAHDIATEFADEAAGLHYCFGDGFRDYYYDYPFERAIDHILVAGTDALTVRRFARYSPDYYLPLSDHSPAYVDAEI